ncbi:MAG: hypothetical protein ACI8TQ_002735 [Planctomycetota bacterium]
MVETGLGEVASSTNESEEKYAHGAWARDVVGELIAFEEREKNYLNGRGRELAEDCEVWEKGAGLRFWGEALSCGGWNRSTDDDGRWTISAGNLAMTFRAGIRIID